MSLSFIEGRKMQKKKAKQNIRLGQCKCKINKRKLQNMEKDLYKKYAKIFAK